MLKALVLGCTTLLSLSSYAATVVCTNPSLGTLTLKGALSSCEVSIQPPNHLPWFSADKRCSETFDGAIYTMSAELYSWGNFDPAMVTIRRGTTSDIRFVQIQEGETSTQFAGHELECKVQ